MDLTFVLINGVSFGLEYVAPAPDADVPYPCIILDVACFRWILEITRP
jgi:hypothetical protein